jgi:hypothetical protein
VASLALDRTNDERRSVMSIASKVPRVVLVVGLISGALALWLSAAAPGHAETANQVQGTVVSVQGKAISWEDNAACGAQRSAGFPPPSATADFGQSPPGGGLRVSAWFLGCVLSNAPWSVDAVATNLVTADASASIPAANLSLAARGIDESFPEPRDPVPAPIAQACDDFSGGDCSLGSTQPVVVGARSSPDASGFLYFYRLHVPGSAPTGTYSGSVTFTASN